MFLRWLIGILIVSFWLVMSVLLVRMAYFPDDSRLALEAPEIVMERFLGRSNNPDLTADELDIWQGKELVGTLKVEPQYISRADRTALNATGRVKIDGRLGVHLPYGAGDTDLTLSATLAMNNKADVKQSDLTLRLEKWDIAVQIIEPGGDAKPQIKLTQHGKMLLDSDTAEAGGGSADGLMNLALVAIGLDPADLSKMKAKAAAEVGTVETVARRGGFEIRGKQFNGYKLITSLGGGDRTFKLSISESGELLHMTTSFMAYEFVTDSLRPVGMPSYENQKLIDLQKTLPPAGTVPPAK